MDLFDQTGLLQSLNIDDAVGFETVQIPYIHQGEFFLKDVGKPPFGYTSLQGHLPPRPTLFALLLEPLGGFNVPSLILQ
jgi:hypothetical protein